MWQNAEMCKRLRTEYNLPYTQSSSVKWARVPYLLSFAEKSLIELLYLDNSCYSN